MKKVLIYGAVCGALVALLRLIEYRYLVLQQSRDVYGGLVALLFSALGIWLGIQLTRRREAVPPPDIAATADAVPLRVPDADRAEVLGITPRELEILQLIAEGLSNRDIAERVFISENTVKTHVKRLFEKLDARRRTQAVQIGKQLGLLQ